jgi:predicted enzyme related to lactoylglutathione lyase
MSIRKLLAATIAAALSSVAHSADFAFAAGRIGAKAAVKAVVAAGGKITTEPVAVGKSGAWIAMAMDTVGNRFKMVQRGAPAPK